MATEKTLGVATNKAQIELGTIDGAVIGGTTPAAGTFTTLIGTTVAGGLDGIVGGVTPAAATVTALTATGNVALGNATSDTIGLYGVTPIAQRAGATQATSLVSVTSASFATAYAAALLEIMNTLTALGIWKGSA
jgi:hypothetical protein